MSTVTSLLLYIQELITPVFIGLYADLVIIYRYCPVFSEQVNLRAKLAIFQDG